MNLKLKFDRITKRYKQKQLAMNQEPFYVPAFIERQSIDEEKLEAEKRHLQTFIF